jgi:hypothetical protein
MKTRTLPPATCKGKPCTLRFPFVLQMKGVE